MSGDERCDYLLQRSLDRGIARAVFLKIHGGEGHFARVDAVERIPYILRFARDQAIGLVPDGARNEVQPGLACRLDEKFNQIACAQ